MSPSLSLASLPELPGNVRGLSPGMSSGIDGARSAGETLVEVAGVWELSWSGVLGARRRRQPWDVWTSGRCEYCEWWPMSGQPIWNISQAVRILLSAVCVVCV